MTVSIEPAKTIVASLIENLSVFEQSEISRNQRIGSLVGEFKILGFISGSRRLRSNVGVGQSRQLGKVRFGAKRTSDETPASASATGGRRKKADWSRWTLPTLFAKMGATKAGQEAGSMPGGELCS
jgi:hypothetical protein